MEQKSFQGNFRLDQNAAENVRCTSWNSCQALSVFSDRILLVLVVKEITRIGS